MAGYLGYTLQMKTRFVADQLWLMKHIQEEDCTEKQFNALQMDTDRHLKMV